MYIKNPCRQKSKRVQAKYKAVAFLHGICYSGILGFQSVHMSVWRNVHLIFKKVSSLFTVQKDAKSLIFTR